MTRPTLRPIVRAIIVTSFMLTGLAAAPGAALAQPPPETVEYYATDALGSVRVVFTATGQVIGRSDYLPFGDTQEQSGMLPRQRFTGQERDGLAGLDDFNARSLQMRTGRMSSPDPLFGNALVNPQRWNRYAYGLNNPLRFTDPSGMDAVDINKLLQDCWGLKAWDDFSQDYWAQGTGYSYGPFSPTLIELSRQGIKWDKLQLDPGGGVVAGFSEANAKPALAALLGSGSASAGVNGAATYQGAGFNVEAYCRAQHGPGPTAPTSPPSSQWLAQALGMARALLSQVVTLASDTKVEWGFGIFRQGDALVSVGPYTDYDQGFVCTRNWRGVWLVNGHSHVVGPLPSGFESTVGGDKAVAQSNPAVIFLMGSPGGPMYNYTGGILRRW